MHRSKCERGIEASASRFSLDRCNWFNVHRWMRAHCRRRRIWYSCVCLRRGAPPGSVSRSGASLWCRQSRLCDQGLLCSEMARLTTQEGLLLDVATGGRLFVALNAGVLPTNACCTATTRVSMSCAWPSLVYDTLVDNFDELDRLDALHSEGLPVPRCNCG